MAAMDALGIAGHRGLPRWAKYMLVVCGIWAIPGVLAATSMYAIYTIKGEDLSIWAALAWRVPEWQVWAFATPLIVMLGRRFPITRLRGLWLAIPIHLVANATVATADAVVNSVFGRLVGEAPFTTEPLLEIVPWIVLKSIFLELIVYWAVIAADRGLAYQRRYRESALRQSQLEARLVEAQLDALKMQLHPHFLFNTLNAITVLMRRGDSANAVRMVGGLSELLRRSLASIRVELVTLREELDFIQRYLDIETMRFPDRLRVALDIADDAACGLVPNLILQPLVENAIEHGIAPRVSGGRISIVARVHGDRLRIEIRDDGVGPGKSSAKGHGVGLSHVRTRLAQLYPGTHRFTLEPNQPAGALAAIEIPFDPAEPEELP
jgi:two-component system, LytTR family, sensor kinase